MADFVQLSDLQTQVQQRADIVNFTTAYSNAYVIELINKGWRDLYGYLCETGEDHYLTIFTWTAVAAQQTYYTTAAAGVPSGTNVLPLDMFKVRGVDAQAVAPNQYNPLQRAEFEQRCDNTGLGAWPWPWPMPKYMYQNSGNNASLYFIPAPQSAIGMRLWYFPVPPLLVNATDQIDAGNGWDVYVVDWAARRVAERDENYELAARLDLSIAEKRERIKVEIANRNAGQAAKIRRVRRRRGYGGGMGYGGPPGF